MVLNESLMRKMTKDEQFVFSKRAQNGQNRAVLEMGCSGWNFLVLEREREPFLSRIVANWTVGFSTEQEGKLFYAARATRGHRFGGVSTTPRGRNLFLLVLILA